MKGGRWLDSKGGKKVFLRGRKAKGERKRRDYPLNLSISLSGGKETN